MSTNSETGRRSLGLPSLRALRSPFLVKLSITVFNLFLFWLKKRRMSRFREALRAWEASY